MPNPSPQDHSMSTFEEALAYIRPHPSTNGPVILKAGMLRCCVSAILMREDDLSSRLTSTETALSDAIARAERAERVLTEACRMPSILFMAGEMTEQERRTAQAVANGIAAKVRFVLSHPEPVKGET